MTTREFAGARWRTSSYSGNNGTCIEVAALDSGRVAARDSKDRQGPVLVFAPGAWVAFLDAVRSGDLDEDHQQPAS
jgi:hypothetical protein